MAAVGMMAYPVRDSFQAYPQQYAMYSQTRAHQPQHEVAQSLNVNPYANFGPSSHPQELQQPPPQVQSQQQRPYQQPSSPSLDDGLKPSLPSISNLLGIADGDRHDAGS